MRLPLKEGGGGDLIMIKCSALLSNITNNFIIVYWIHQLIDGKN